MACDDCICTGSCAFVTKAEQPYFQAYRLAKRLPLGASWKSYEFMAWIGSQWRAWRRLRGLGPYQSVTHEQRDDFEAWLFDRVGHPAAQVQKAA
jgi:hypothetical protein